MKSVLQLCAAVSVCVLLAFFGSAGCGVPVSEFGKVGKPCYGNGTCNAGLACTNNVCESGGSKEAVSEGTAEGTTQPDVSTPEDATPAPDKPKDDKFSFFVTSLEAMRKLSGSNDGFGGDLGGLEGADRICQTIAAGTGYGHKVWRAFLSVTKGPDGKAVNAIDRVGKGPWYDRNGRLISKDISGLMGDRPAGDAQAVKDLANEHGQGQLQFGDNHDTVTGSNKQGKLFSTALNSTCQDWTSKIGPGSESKIQIGHSWPRSAGGGGGGGTGGANWMSDHTARGCSAGVNLLQNGPGTGDCIGCSGGYGGIYCFAINGSTYQESGTKCTKDAECQATQRCFVGYCIPKAPGCRSDADCTGDKKCQQSATGVACAEPPPPCKSDTDCERGQRCNAGTCVTQGGPGPQTCTADSDCQGGDMCVALGPQKTCAPDGTGETCTQTSDCKARLQCVSTPQGKLCIPGRP